MGVVMLHKAELFVPNVIVELVNQHLMNQAAYVFGAFLFEIAVISHSDRLADMFLIAIDGKSVQVMKSNAVTIQAKTYGGYGSLACMLYSVQPFFFNGCYHFAVSNQDCRRIMTSVFGKQKFTVQINGIKPP